MIEMITKSKFLVSNLLPNLIKEAFNVGTDVLDTLIEVLSLKVMKY